MLRRKLPIVRKFVPKIQKEKVERFENLMVGIFLKMGKEYSFVRAQKKVWFDFFFGTEVAGEKI